MPPFFEIEDSGVVDSRFVSRHPVIARVTTTVASKIRCTTPPYKATIGPAHGWLGTRSYADSESELNLELPHATGWSHLGHNPRDLSQAQLHPRPSLPPHKHRRTWGTPKQPARLIPELKTRIVSLTAESFASGKHTQAIDADLFTTIRYNRNVS